MGVIPSDFTCLECSSPLEYFDGGTERIKGTTYTWESWICTNSECGEKYSEEPDWDDFRT